MANPNSATTTIAAAAAPKAAGTSAPAICPTVTTMNNTLDYHRLEGHGHGHKIQAAAKAGMRIRSHLVDLFTTNRGFIALRLYARRSQCRFAQPG